MSSKAKNFDGPPNLTDSDNDSDSDTESKGDKFSPDNSESDEESIPSLHEQELDQDPVDTNQDKAKVVKTSEELRTEGNNLFSKGDHTLAIEKYEDAIKTGKISPDDKVKCYR